MIKLKHLILIFGMVFVLMNTCNAMNYKWSSTIPVEFVPLSNVDDENKLEHYMLKSNIIIFYEDEDFNNGDKYKQSAIRYKLNNYIKAYNTTLVSPTNKSCEFFVVGHKKLYVPHQINPDDKYVLDFVGWYVSECNGTFAYINKVPPHYKHTVISGVAVQKTIPDENGEYAVDVAGRKIKVNLRDDDLINKKIETIKGLSKALNINITYISTGSESINVIKKEDVDVDELDDLLNYYWFKKWHSSEYTHIYCNPSNIKTKYNVDDFDILAMSYYPIIHVDKAPETFENDPVGGYYPNSIHYKGTMGYGYWDDGVDSKNKYYHYDSDDPYWNSDDKYVDNWYYEGSAVLPANDTEMNDRYKYFNHWFVKNYGYALSEGVDGLLLLSSDEHLVDAVFGKDNDDLDWKLDINNKVRYVAIPDEKGISKEGNITILKIPKLAGDEICGVHHISENYIPPKDEEFGVYIADIVKYDTSKIYDLKDNYTWICSFKNYVDWADNYLKSRIIIKNNTISVKSDNNVKLTVYTKNINNSLLSKYSIEEYDDNINMVVIDNPSSNTVILN